MESQENKRVVESEDIPFFPKHLLTEVVVAFAVLGVVLLAAGIWPKELGAPANTIMTPSHILPEWYFVWLFGLLKIVPELVGIFLAGLFVVVLLLFPWIDRSKSNALKARSKILTSAALSLVILVVLTIIGFKA